MSHPSPHSSDAPNYETWTREELIAPQPPPSDETKPGPGPSNPRPKDKASRPRREFNFSAYPVRKIALKFSYSGAGYCGLAWQAGATPLPTVEGVLFAALAKARLVDPEGGLEACSWERCGRTDRGVSAAAQVVSLYVRCSNRPSSASSSGASVETSEGKTSTGEGDGGEDDGLRVPVDHAVPGATATTTTTTEGLRYLHTLNAILPPTIRVHAWAPVKTNFSARFSCRARHYKYFFSGRNLDVDAMRSGAARLVGEHDFRNLCKLDPAKQLTSFRRRILRAGISTIAADDDNDDRGGGGGRGDRDGMHVFDLVGTAFLYNQVRHIMAVLLLIGARLEAPSVISALLNADPDERNGAGGEERGESPPRVRCKPEYQMADALPLVLWDCVYGAEDAPWRTDDAGQGGGSVGLHSQLTGLAERARVEATLGEYFLRAASRHHGPGPTVDRESGPLDVPLGGGRVRREGRYIGLLERKRMEPVEVVNARWRRRGKE
ncbi:pseudouridine synthase [Russula earlei]|uniref:Pseudouridine synthase n=1 Tax=Russula earlei TaxID=71964 RepID=A0ACC0U1A8_9AGAM|nr:pseudouridine synthase [Russula earlei]